MKPKNILKLISGIKPQKTPIFNPTPSPKNPQCFFILCPHPRPKISGTGWGRGWSFEKNWGFFGDGDDFNFGDFLGFHPRKSPKKIGEILGTRIACNLGIFGFFPRKTPIFGDSPKIPVLMNTKCSSMLFIRIHGCSLCKGITTCTEILGMEESLCS